MPALFAQHLIDDAEFQKKALERFEGLATKEDTREILTAIKTVHLGFGIVKVGWKTFLTAGAVAGAVLALLAFGKIFWMWLVGLILASHH